MSAAHTHQEVEGVQRALNGFLSKDPSLGFAKLRVDGDNGQATKQRIKDGKFFLGYVESRRDAAFGDELLWRLHNPKTKHAATKAAPFKVDAAAIERGNSRRTERRKAVVRNHAKAIITSGVAHYDGKPVFAGAVWYLDYARKTGVTVGGVHYLWHGTLTSGWRDPVYSRGVCMRKCGRPSCPGTCAGLSSNHVGTKMVLRGPGSKFALDTSDYDRFGFIMAHIPDEALAGRPRLMNHLPNDRVHFSPSGN